jgi:hypothetical protein
MDAHERDDPAGDEQRALRMILQGTASETGERSFAALVENLARAMGTHGAWVTEYLPDSRRLLFHWKEESQHALLDELEWRRADAALAPAARDAAVDEFIALVGAVDGILQAQAAADVAYFSRVAAGRYDAGHLDAIGACVLRAYRWQYILSGAQNPRFTEILGELITSEQGQRIGRALAPLVA